MKCECSYVLLITFHLRLDIISFIFGWFFSNPIWNEMWLVIIFLFDWFYSNLIWDNMWLALYLVGLFNFIWNETWLLNFILPKMVAPNIVQIAFTMGLQSFESKWKIQICPKCHLVNCHLVIINSHFKIFVSHKNIILISNLTILNIFIQTHIFVLNIQNIQPTTIIPNGNGQNILK